eukprot:30983-Pelagococcus_subviridis.AAC.4
MVMRQRKTVCIEISSVLKKCVQEKSVSSPSRNRIRGFKSAPRSGGARGAQPRAPTLVSYTST